MKTLQQDLRDLINKHGAENVSNTQDLVLAAFLISCLEAFDNAVNLRTAMSEPIASARGKYVADNYPGVQPHQHMFDEVTQAARKHNFTKEKE